MFDKEQGHITKEDGQMMIQDLSPLHYLEIVCSHSPVVARAIKKYGDVSLADALKKLTPDSRPSFQQRADLVERVYRYAALP